MGTLPIGVIGSGPAAVAAIAALIKKGIKVRVLDVGHQIDGVTAAKVQSLVVQEPTAWNKENLSAIKGKVTTSTKGLSQKLSFGSDFPYRVPSYGVQYESQNTGILPSFALGGLSNVWGAAMLPYCNDDISDWPIQEKDLAVHYQAVADLTGLAAEKDDLEKIFPLYTSKAHSLKPNAQIQKFLKDLNSSRDRLWQKKIIFGRSRLAFSSSSLTSGCSCQYCTLCMHGCPYNVIFNSSTLINHWKAAGLIEYVDQKIVTHVEEKNHQVAVHGISLEGIPFKEHFDRVFLAAGVLPSTAIMLRSQNRYEESVIVHDSQYFLFPFLRFLGNDDVMSERMHVLSQVFLEILDQEISPHFIHLQFYGYNDLLYPPLKKILRSDFLIKKVLPKILIAQGFFHSDHSSKLQLVLHRSVDKVDQLKITPLFNPTTSCMINKVMRKLASLAFSLKGIPIAPMLHIEPVGRGFHSGGSFPMSKSPSDKETDMLGRPDGYQRLHFVDASIFPSISATTITYTVMANAHRIASQSIDS